MTEHARCGISRIRRDRPRAFGWGQLSFCMVSLLFLILFLRNADLAMAYLFDGLILCAHTLIPSLFPFMVISELIVAGGVMRPLGRLLSRPFRRLLGIGEESVSALLLGFLCGFPLGAKAAASLYRQGRIGTAELRRLMTFCNVPSAAFLINTVGLSLFGSTSLGILLYAVTLLSALLVGALGNLIHRSTKGEKPSAPPMPKPTRLSPLTAFTEAVGSSALAMLRVCAFVLFFSALVGILERSALSLSLSPSLSALFFGAFELTGGVSRAALCPAATAPYVCAMLAGWSGLSVHFQIISLCDGIPLSVSSYFLAKLAHAVLNTLLLWLCLSVHALLA